MILHQNNFHTFFRQLLNGLADRGNEQFAILISEFTDTVKGDKLDIFGNSVAFLAQEPGEHISMVISVCENTVKGQGIIRFFVPVQKQFHLFKFVAAFQHVEKIRLNPIFFAGE